MLNNVLLYSLFFIITFFYFLNSSSYFSIHLKNSRCGSGATLPLDFTVFALAAVVICTPLLFLPPGRDMAWFAFNGMNLTNHILPYIDRNDFNMPGQTLLYALLIYLFGNSVFILRLAELLLLILSALALAFFLKRHAKIPYWMLIVIYYFFNYMSYGYYFTGERDGFVLFFIILSLWAIFNVRDESDIRKKLVWIFFSGLFAGTTILFRTTYIVFLFFLIPFVIFKLNNFKQILLFNLSAVSPVCLLVLALFYVDGWNALQKFYENIFIMPRQVYSQFYNGGEMFSLDAIFTHLEPIKWWLAIIIFFRLGSLYLFNKKSAEDKQPFHMRLKRAINFDCYKNEENEIIVFCFMFFAAFFSIVFIQGSFQYYHAIPLRFVIFLLCMLYLKKFLSAIDYFQEDKGVLPLKRKKNLFMVILMIAALISTTIYMEHSHDYLRVYGIKQNYLFIMNKNYAPHKPDYDPTMHHKLGLYLNKMSGERDKIQLWMIDSLAYFYANRSYSSTQTNPILLWLGTGYAKKKLYQEYLSDIKQNPPKFFVVEKRKEAMLTPTYAGFAGITDNNINANINNYPEVYNFIITNYKLFSSMNNEGYDYMIYIYNK